MKCKVSHCGHSHDELVIGAPIPVASIHFVTASAICDMLLTSTSSESI
jgi:hypothetical protein